MSIKRWTEQEVKEVIELRKRGTNIHQIADIMNRSYDSIKHKLDSLRDEVVDKEKMNKSNDVCSSDNQDEVGELKKENDELKKQLYELHQQTRSIVHNVSTERYKFGIVSDTHLCSYYESLEALDMLYSIFSDEEINHVYHAGDLLDGQKMYAGQEYELHTIGLAKQVDYFVENYPTYENITTFFITGNHDLCYYKREGIDIGYMIHEKREDMVYLAPEQADVRLTDDSDVIIRLEHPGGGTACAISYKAQKNVESLSGGTKPNLLILGHYHKSEFLPIARNVPVIQAGTMQRQTPYMRRKTLAAHTGAFIVDMSIDEVGINKLKVEWIYFYEQNGKLIITR